MVPREKIRHLSVSGLYDLLTEEDQIRWDVATTNLLKAFGPAVQTLTVNLEYKCYDRWGSKCSSSTVSATLRVFKLEFQT